MAAPTRFPAGVSTYKPQNLFNTFPSVPMLTQMNSRTVPAAHYLAGQYTVTSTTSTVGAGIYNAVAAGLITGFNGGVVSMAITTASGGKAGIAYTGNIATNQTMAFIPGNKVWFKCQVAHNSLMLNTANETTAVVNYGLMDVTDPTAAVTNGVYFQKPAGANVLNLVIKNTGLTGSTVTTTVANVADISKPSGIFGDTSSTVGTLTTAGAANKYASVVVATPGAGYSVAPLVRALGANAASPYAGLYVQTASGSLYAPYITHIGGTGYTTFTNEVNHWTDLEFYYDGSGVLHVGVNGKQVCTVGVNPNNIGVVSGLAAGGTSTGTPNSFYVVNTNMTSSIAPVTPSGGSFDNIMPMVPLNPAIGFSLATLATDIMFVNQLQFGAEYN